MNYLPPGVYVEEVPSAVRPIAGVGTSTAGFIGVVPSAALVVPKRRAAFDPTQPVSDSNLPWEDDPFTITVPAGEARLCTTFNDFTSQFGAFSTDAGQSNLVHAVYGFFHNGGSRCDQRDGGTVGGRGRSPRARVARKNGSRRCLNLAMRAVHHFE